MMRDFELVAIIRNHNKTKPMRIPLQQSSRDDLKEKWGRAYVSFIHEFEQIDFETGYQLKQNQCFRFREFDLPVWLSKFNNQTLGDMDELPDNQEIYDSVQGTVAFTSDNNDKELLLFQDFSKSKVLTPGQCVFPDGSTYRNIQNNGLLLDRELSAVFITGHRLLAFRDYRAVNSFLPLANYSRKVFEQEVSDLLEQDLLLSEETLKWAKSANQWFRTRFIHLKNSGILGRYSAKEIQSRAKGYNISIKIQQNKIVFPSDRASAKKLLLFLNEDLYKGSITEMIYEARGKNPIG